jgi:hypothetical protein
MHRGIWTRLLRRLLAPTQGGAGTNRLARNGRSKGLRTARPSVRPQLEGLEDRTLLSAVTTYIVNVTGDNAGAQGTGSFVNLNTPGGVVQVGEGNLRWCVNQADLPANNGSTIWFDQTVFNPATPTTIGLSNGELPISNNLKIDNDIADKNPLGQYGGGASTILISGTDGNGGGSRVFDIIPSTVTVSINGLTITNGNANVYYTTLPGNQGGDIFNGGSLTLTDDVVENGQSIGTVGGPQGRGGGIFNAEGQNGAAGASLTLNNTLIENNTAEGSNGLGAGGGIYNDINATVIVNNGIQFQDNQALGNNSLGVGAGGAIFNFGTLQLNGAATSHIGFTDNVAQGGTQTFGLPGGNAFGGAIYNGGSIQSMRYVDYLGNQALGGAGGQGGDTGEPDVGGQGSENGGNGGNAYGGGVYNAGTGTLTLANIVFGVDAKGLGNEAVGGVGGNGEDGDNRSENGGNAGNGGAAFGGAVASISGGLAFKSASFTSSEAIGGNGGAGGSGYPGYLPTNTEGSAGGAGGKAGDAGDAEGGAVFNSTGVLSFTSSPFVANIAQGGQGGTGGPGAGGDTGAAGATGGAGGFGGAGGIGGGAQGGGFYNVNAALTVNGGSFTANAVGVGNEAIGGNGGNGGIGGNGGQGGDNGAGIGGAGGGGGSGGDSRGASGGAGEDVNSPAPTPNDPNPVSISAIITSSLVRVGNGGTGGNGGRGGNSGNTPSAGVYGGAGGDGGTGGSAGPGFGGALAIASSTLSLTNSTIGGSTAALGNQVIGGAGGNGGTGGGIGAWGHPSTTYVVAYGSSFSGNPAEGVLNPAGNGGAGGAGSSVSGGAVSVTTAQQTGVDMLSRYQGLNFSQSGPYQGINELTPNPQGAAGPDSYVEAINQSVAIFSRTTGTSIQTDSLPDFFKNVGGLQHAFFGQYIDPAVVWDDQIQRFIIVDLDVDGSFNNPIVTQHKSYLDIAVSTSADPTTLTAADWNFYQVATTEDQNGAYFDPQFTGNLGWNNDALVATLNMYNTSGIENHVQVDTISLNALTTAGTTLTEGTNAFQFDYTGANLRPTVMHDSKAGDPMWFVQAGTHLNAQNQFDQINVVELANPLSTSGAFTTTPLQVKAYSAAVPMLQPGAASTLGNNQLTGVSSDIEKVAEYNNLLATAQTVSDLAGDEDSIQWYEINVTGGTPVLQQQGDVSGGTEVYDAFPSIDINQNGDLGMTFSQSGRGNDQFLSMYVTGRAAGDLPGTMRTPILAQAGQDNYHGDLLGISNPVGPVSGISVDSDGSFWAVNQYADLETFTNWSTAIVHFAIPSSTAPIQTVNIDHTTFTTSGLAGGNGGAGGSAGLGSDDGRNHGINGPGGNGGGAQGGAVFLSSRTAQEASLDTVTIASSSAIAGSGGAGAINTLGGDNVTFYYRSVAGANGSVFGWNGFGSNGGDGGSVKGVGLAAENYGLNNGLNPLQPWSDVSFSGGIGIAGSGGNGGGANATVPRSWDGGSGGAGGSVLGGGVFLSNNLNSTTALYLDWSGGSASNFRLTAGAGGSGGNAGASTTINHRSNVAGGSGGAGGNAQGGGIYTFAGSQSINVVSYTNLNVLGDQLSAGTGGQGGAGYLANGGIGGSAQGAGVFNTSLNTTSGQNSSLSITASTLAGDDATGGDGGNAGSGTTPNGGAGGTGGNAGSADGGGLFNGQNANLTVVNSTFGGESNNSATPNAYANILTSGLGGRGGNAGTPAGVPKNDGGGGGNGGSVAGGDVYVSGAVLTAPTAPKLVAGSGGSWTAQTAWVLITYVNANGETTGSAISSVAVPLNGTLTIDSPVAEGTGSGAATGWYAYVGVGSTQPASTLMYRQQAAGSPTAIGTNYTLSGIPTTTGANPPTANTASVGTATAVFMDDTVVEGQASIFGLGGAGGSGAGQGGSAGSAGNTGTGLAGGYFAALGSSNILGNTILAFNNAAADPDAAGSFISKGYNLLTSTTGASGFSTGTGGTDQLVTTAYSANLGPLLNNGGATMTDAVLLGSAAQSSGSVSVIPTGVTTDQRGAGFPRTFNNTVSSGAFQFLPPVIASLSPSSVVEGSPGITLTITGSNFASGATVTFGSKTNVLTPISSSATQLVVVVPGSLLTTPGPVSVVVNIPDGSGSGTTEPSAPATFTILATPFTLNNPGNQTGYVGGSVNLQITTAAGFTAQSFTATGLPAGLTIDDTGKISGTITANPGAYSVTINASDTNGDLAPPITFTWTVGPALYLNPVPAQSSDEGDTAALQITAPPGYTPSGFAITAGQLPPGLSLNTTSGLISGTIDPRGAGTYTVTIVPTNNNGQGGITFTWTVLDTTPPTLTNPGSQSSSAGQSIDLPIKNVDAESGTWTATGLPPGLNIDANGVIYGTIASNANGVYAVAVQASDSYTSASGTLVTVQSSPVSFFWVVSNSAATSSPPLAASAPGTVPAGTTGAATSTTIANVTNQYQGFVQVETVTVDVTSVNGYVVNEGVVAISVDGQTDFAPVHNGVATATFATGLFDTSLLTDLVFSHPLTVSYSDGAGTFASSSASTTEPAIWIDFLLTMLALDIGQLDQLQG